MHTIFNTPAFLIDCLKLEQISKLVPHVSAYIFIVAYEKRKADESSFMR